MEPRILIIGGGIGGLTLGALLRKRGLDPELIEAAPEWKPVGAGITLGINAMRVYRDLGASEALVARGRALEEAYISDARGRVLSRMDFRDLSERHGPSVAIHRADLHAVLAELNPGARLGTTAASIDDTGAEVLVTFSDGESEEYDLVIGADGIHSTTREAVCANFEYRYSGYTCWRFMVDVDPAPVMTVEMWGPGRRFGVVPLAGTRVYCFSTLNSPENAAQWKSLTLEGYRGLFAGFGGEAPRILDALESDAQLIHNDLAEVRVPQWTKNRVGLLGDAAHAMTPNMGQGAAMAIEDAWVLDQEIAALGANPEALAAYEKRRRTRVETIQGRSWTIGKVGQLANPIGVGLRNSAVRLSPDKAAAKSIELLLTARI